MILFDGGKCIDICLKNKNKYVFRAVKDLIGDFYRISAGGIKPKITDRDNGNCIVIEENASDMVYPIEDESFTIKSEPGRIRISAVSYFGTIWGIYTFCEEILGVDPCYLFGDLECKKMQRLEIGGIDIKRAPDGFGFRGIFINDEDLLTGWKEPSGVRFMDYRFYGVTLNEKVMDMVAETAVRLKFNLIIPASFLDIDNPFEKRLADIVAQRGIFISQHHIEPLGVSGMAFERYCKNHGKNGSFSYEDNPGLLEEAWKFYAEKWAHYDNVLWQIGLRGRGDNPAWGGVEPDESILKKYGGLISGAMEKQIEIIKSAAGDKAKYFSSTLWMEGSALMRRGLLHVPKGAIMVFADNGPDQMYGIDFYEIPRRPGMDYGIYYHVQYFGDGPHLAPLTGVDKLYYNIGLAFNSGCRSYSILNVSNIREFTFEIKAYSEMLWDFKGFSCKEYMDGYTAKFRENAGTAAKLIGEYYDSIAVLNTKLLPLHFGTRFNYAITREAPGIRRFTAKDGFVRRFGEQIISEFHQEIDNALITEIYDGVKKSLPRYEKVSVELEAFAEGLSEPLKKHIKVKWLLYAVTMKCIYGWYKELYEAKRFYDAGESREMISSLRRACGYLEEYLRYRKCGEYGIFENWYSGDLKMDMNKRLFDTYRLLGQNPDLKKL